MFQVNCGETEEPGYGKRKKRSLYPHQRNGTATTDNIYMGKTKNWEENLELKIRMPPDLLVQSSKSISDNHESRPLRESECKIYLIVTLSVALTFCVLSATIVVVACFKKYQVSKISDAGFNPKRAKPKIRLLGVCCKIYNDTSCCNFGYGHKIAFFTAV